MKVLKSTHVLIPHLLAYRENVRKNRRNGNKLGQAFWTKQVKRVIAKVRAA